MMYTYKDTIGNTVQRNDGVWVPKVSDEYLTWRAEGNTPEPADQPPMLSSEPDAISKLRTFLATNPDVAEILK